MLKWNVGKTAVSILLLSLLLLSSAVAAAEGNDDYQPGTLNVRMPSAFIPAPIPVEVEVPLEPGDVGYAEAQAQIQQRAAASGKNNASSRLPLTKTITKYVSAPSPFQDISYSDFQYYANPEGHYQLSLPKAFGHDPLKGLPISGPAFIRSKSDVRFMAATVDDPTDTKHYRNQKTFPDFKDLDPITTETRRTVQNYPAECRYLNYRMGEDGTDCLVITAAINDSGKTYRLLYVFPYEYRYRFLPLALYSLENFRLDSGS